MITRILNYVLTVMIVISVLFLVFFVLATSTTLITQEGSILNQGYVGSTNLHIVALGALVVLTISVLINWKNARQDKKTKLVRDAGALVLLLTGLFFLIAIITAGAAYH